MGMGSILIVSLAVVVLIVFASIIEGSVLVWLGFTHRKEYTDVSDPVFFVADSLGKDNR